MANKNLRLARIARFGHALLATVAIAASLGGCALWPSMTSDHDLNPRNDPTARIPCDTINYGLARRCAIVTRQELMKIEEDAVVLRRGAAYGIFALATASGAAAAFRASNDVLKSLAIGTASLVGLHAVANPDKQIMAAREGKREIDCAIRAADAQIELIRSQGADRVAQIFAQQVSRATGPQQDRTRRMANRLQDAITRNDVRAVARKLSYAVLDIRNRTREKLGDTIVGDLKTAEQAQRNYTVSIIGSVVRARAELQKQLREADSVRTPTPPATPSTGEREEVPPATTTPPAAPPAETAPPPGPKKTVIEALESVDHVLQSCTDTATYLAIVGGP